MDRKTARAQAMKLIYEWEMGGDGGEETKLGLLEIAPNEGGSDFMNTLSEGVQANADALDERLKPFLRGWTLERVTRVDLAILRLAAYELIHTATPEGIVINEAVELANQYSTEKAGAFINGVLGSLARSLREQEE
ncbi:MAG: transcription antitermination factor NusB [Clostridia bacterium]|nr:transcription antitermination factor NusB [Clostridia bacterium]